MSATPALARRSWRAAVIATAAFTALSGFAALPAQAAAGPTATFTKVSDWGSGFTASVKIASGSVALSSWKVELTLPAGTSVGAYWEALMTRTGDRYVFTNRNYNGSVPVGGSVSFGFNGIGGGSPVSCKLNDKPCTGGPGDPDTTAPTAPGSLQATGTTSSSVSLGWTASTDNVGVDGYDVYQEGVSTPVGTTKGTSHTVSGLAAKTTYKFTVKARDAAGNVSPASNQVSATTKDGGPGPSGGLKVGYFTQWGVYDQNFFVKNLDTSGTAAKLTHLNYAFGNIDSTGKCFQINQAGQGDAWADYQQRLPADKTVSGQPDQYEQPLAGNLNQLKQLKAKHPHLKVYISFGGWTWSKYFSNAALTDASRKAHVSSCLDMWIKGNLPKLGGEPQGGPGAAAGVFDGIDLDWEWPASEGNTGNVVRPEDKQNFTLLAAEWKRQLAAFGVPAGKTYGLSAFLPADPRKVEAGFEVDKIFNYLDFGTVQGYDFHGGWDKTTFNQSAIRLPAGDPGPVPFSSEIAINAYTDKGAPANKLVLGVPFYSRGWTGVTNANNGLHQPATGPAPGTFEEGYEDYKKVKNLVNSGYTVYRDPVAGHAWLFNGSTFWTFDDPTEMARKTAWIKSRGLGGAMIWSLDADTPDGELITAVSNGIG